MKQQIRKNRIAFPVQLFDKTDSQVALADASNVREIHVVPTGEWKHWSGSEFKISAEDITEMKRRFDEGVRKGIRVTAGHDIGFSSGELPAIGWFQEVIDRGANGLYATVEWTKEGMRLLSEHAFKYFSAELEFNYKDLETEREYPILLVGGALTNRPFFKQLDKDPSFGFSDEDKKVSETVLQFSVPDIMNQFNDEDRMNKEDILAKPSSEWTEEEIAFMKSDDAGLTDEEKEAHKDVLADGEGDSAEGGDGSGDGDGDGEGAEEGEDDGDDGDGAGDGTEGGDEGGNSVAASDGKSVTLSAEEYAALKTAADKGAIAFEDNRKMKLANRLDGLTLSASNPEGRLLPKSRKAVLSFMESLKDNQVDQFENIVKAMPKAVDLTEVGEGDGEDAKTSAKLVTLASERAKADKISFSEALRIVLSENPDLSAEHESAKGEDA